MVTVYSLRFALEAQAIGIKAFTAIYTKTHQLRFRQLVAKALSMTFESRVRPRNLIFH